MIKQIHTQGAPFTSQEKKDLGSGNILEESTTTYGAVKQAFEKAMHTFSATYSLDKSQCKIVTTKNGVRYYIYGTPLGTPNNHDALSLMSLLKSIARPLPFNKYALIG